MNPDCTNPAGTCDCKVCAARAVVASPIWRNAFSHSGFGWSDRKLQQLMEFYKVDRAQVQHAVEMDARHGETA